MLIAVQANLWGGSRAAGGYLADIVVALATQNTSHRFLLLTNRIFRNIEYPANVQVLQVSEGMPVSKSKADVQVAKALKVSKADLLICTNQANSKTNVPQLLLVLEQVAEQKRFFPFAIFKRAQSYHFAKANRILVSTSLLTSLNTLLPLLPQATPIHVAAQDYFKPIDWQQRECIKEQYTQGNEFVLCNVGPSAFNVVQVLKAFSQFKKWQRTNMKLVLLGQDKEITEKLKTYKYRTDVVELQEIVDTKTLALLVAGSYAMLTNCNADFVLEILQVAKSGVPVINVQPVMDDVADAVLYAPLTEPAALSEHMKRLFKDEGFRNQQIALGLRLSEKFNWQNLVSTLQLAMQQVVK